MGEPNGLVDSRQGTPSSSDAGDDEDDDDPVVDEIPVFLSKAALKNLYLFQYPVRPSSMPYDAHAVRSARIKPRQKRIELMMGVDTTSANYDNSKGEQIALNVAAAEDPNAGDPKSRLFGANRMDRQTLASTLALESTTRYAAGTLICRKRKLGPDDDNDEEHVNGDDEDDSTRPSLMPLEMHLTPLLGIAQLRPSYNYLDLADVAKAKREAENNSSADEEEEEEAQQVLVRYSRGGGRGGAARGGRGGNVSQWRRRQRKLDEEPWVDDITWHGSMDTEELILRLDGSSEYSIKKEEAEDEVDTQKRPKDYIKTLMPAGNENGETTQPAMPSNVLSLMELKSLSVPEALKMLLANAKVMRFAQIVQLLPREPQLTTPEILKHLQQVAVLIQGCWVVKSDILYPEKYCSRHSGVASTLLCRGRDYMLWKFTQSRHVIRKDVQSTTKLPAEDVLEMLEGVARMRHGHGWHFRVDFDSEFIGKHGDIVNSQKAFWDQRVKSLISQGLKINLSTSNSAPELHSKSRNRLNSEVSSSDESDGGRKTNSPRMPRSRKSSFRGSLNKGQQSPASKSPTVSRKAMKGRRDSDAKKAGAKAILFKDGEGSSETMQIEEIAPSVNGHSTRENTSKTMDDAPENATNDEINQHVSPEVPMAIDHPNSNLPSNHGSHLEFSQFIAEKLTSASVAKLSDLKRMFQFRLAELEPGGELGKYGFNEKMVETAVTQSGGVRIKTAWHKGSEFPEEPVYAWLNHGDGLDDYRRLALPIFAATTKFSVKSFRTKLEEAWRLSTGKGQEETLPDEVVKRLRNDFCVTKSTSVFLKGTVSP